MKPQVNQKQGEIKQPVQQDIAKKKLTEQELKKLKGGRRPRGDGC